MADSEGKEKKVRFNQQNLHQEEVFSDLTVGSIRRLTPVKPNGEPDKNRAVLFVGQSQIYTQQGPMPIQFPIDAKNLQLAMEKFPEAMEEFVAHLVEQAKEMQRQEQSRLIVPGGATSGGSNIIL
jgi:phosphoenolpyruvate carboxylase